MVPGHIHPEIKGQWPIWIFLTSEVAKLDFLTCQMWIFNLYLYAKGLHTNICVQEMPFDVALQPEELCSSKYHLQSSFHGLHDGDISLPVRRFFFLFKFTSHFHLGPTIRAKRKEKKRIQY